MRHYFRTDPRVNCQRGVSHASVYTIHWKDVELLSASIGRWRTFEDPVEFFVRNRRVIAGSLSGLAIRFVKDLGQKCSRGQPPPRMLASFELLKKITLEQCDSMNV